MIKFKIFIVFNLLLNVTLQQQTRSFDIDNKDNLNRNGPYGDINNFNSDKQSTMMRFESHIQNQSPPSNPKSESEKSDTLTKILQLIDFNGNIINSAVKISASGKIRPTTLHEPDISLFVKPQSEPGFMFLSRRNIAQDLKYDLLQEPIPKVKVVSNEDEKKQSGLSRKPKPDREKKLEPVLKPGPDLYDKVESNLSDKTEPSPKQEPELDLNKKQDAVPYQEIEPNLDEKTEPDTAESDSKTGNEPNQRSDSESQFWNTFTITLVTVAISVTCLVVLVGAYHYGKVRAKVNSSILRVDVQPPIIIPRVRNVHENPIHSNYV